jgi:hypothetical protein
MWRSVFLHEFIDHKISNFQAVAGRATPASFALTPQPHTESGVNSVEVTNGKGFEYMLDEPLRQVIGISCRVSVSYPVPNPGLGHVQGFHMSLGFGTIVHVSERTHPLPDLSGIMAQSVMTVAQSKAGFGRVKIPANPFTDLRFDWHTSGQVGWS